jgi:hypothetical protein
MSPVRRSRHHYDPMEGFLGFVGAVIVVIFCTGLIAGSFAGMIAILRHLFGWMGVL